jgi:hypothetical protein
VSGPGPGREALAQLGYVVRAEAERREHPVAPLVKTLRGLGEVPVGQPWVQPPGEADDLLPGVPVQGRRRIHVVARFDPAGFSELVAGLGVVLAERATKRPVVLGVLAYSWAASSTLEASSGVGPRLSLPSR